MTKRDVVRAVLEGKRPPYVPWACAFTSGARAAVCRHFGSDDLHAVSGNHVVYLNHVLTRGAVSHFDDLGNGRVRDHFGVVWNRSESKEVGVVEGCVLPEPTMAGYRMPDASDPRFTRTVPEMIERHGDGYRVFCISQSLYERACTMRGMTNVLADFYENPAFLAELLARIAEWNVELARRVIERFDVDAIYFGDDWGQQRGLQMGPRLWREFLLPPFRRMCEAVRDAGRAVFLHSCGNVSELLDELVELGVTCLNPFQPEAMDVDALLPRYRERLTFHGGLSTQRTLPHGSPDDVRRETRHLLELGR
ncbi:MAG TPA: uroporphyrinogen decarboxylase family protein, partial [Thermoguttaceae bacterium]|nr:uroporphyrinogen decarboxylase family protein [Thermoguttaceae bacterium]